LFKEIGVLSNKFYWGEAQTSGGFENLHGPKRPDGVFLPHEVECFSLNEYPSSLLFFEAKLNTNPPIINSSGQISKKKGRTTDGDAFGDAVRYLSAMTVKVRKVAGEFSIITINQDFEFKIIRVSTSGWDDELNVYPIHLSISQPLQFPKGLDQYQVNDPMPKEFQELANWIETLIELNVENLTQSKEIIKDHLILQTSTNQSVQFKITDSLAVDLLNQSFIFQVNNKWCFKMKYCFDDEEKKNFGKEIQVLHDLN
jgi:hypothetical protein